MGLFRANAANELRSTLTEMVERVEILDAQQERLHEALTRGHGLAALKKEDIGWRLISGPGDADEELPLSDIKEHAGQARALRVANPLVKRGILVRNAYIWSDPIKYPEAAQPIIDNPINQKNLFGDEAQEVLEAALNTDGQYFLLCDVRNKTVRQIPLREITGVVTNPEHDGEVWYYKRSYKITTTNTETGNTREDARDVYIPAIDYDGEVRHRIGKIPVDNDFRIEHNTVNRQVDWKWGVPDILGAVYWARAYKEYLEASHTLAKSLARLAFKVTSQSGKGQKQAAARMAVPTTASQSGATAMLGMGQDLVAINKSGSGVDFGAGSPLAAMVAASLDIPLSVLLTDGSAGGRQGAENALEAPTLNTINLRRRTHLASRIRVLRLFGVEEEPTWSKATDEQIHRAMQALQLGYNLNVLHREEVREATVRILNIVTDRKADDLPELPDPVAAAPDNADSPGPLSDGTNDSRDNPGGPTDA